MYFLVSLQFFQSKKAKKKNIKVLLGERKTLRNSTDKQHPRKKSDLKSWVYQKSPHFAKPETILTLNPNSQPNFLKKIFF